MLNQFSRSSLSRVIKKIMRRKEVLWTVYWRAVDNTVFGTELGSLQEVAGDVRFRIADTTAKDRPNSLIDERRPVVKVVSASPLEIGWEIRDRENTATYYFRLVTRPLPTQILEPTVYVQYAVQETL